MSYSGTIPAGGLLATLQSAAMGGYGAAVVNSVIGWSTFLSAGAITLWKGLSDDPGVIKATLIKLGLAKPPPPPPTFAEQLRLVLVHCLSVLVPKLRWRVDILCMVLFLCDARCGLPVTRTVVPPLARTIVPVLIRSLVFCLPVVKWVLRKMGWREPVTDRNDERSRWFCVAPDGTVIRWLPHYMTLAEWEDFNSYVRSLFGYNAPTADIIEGLPTPEEPFSEEGSLAGENISDVDGLPTPEELLSEDEDTVEREFYANEALASDDQGLADDELSAAEDRELTAAESEDSISDWDYVDEGFNSDNE